VNKALGKPPNSHVTIKEAVIIGIAIRECSSMSKGTHYGGRACRADRASQEREAVKPPRLLRLTHPDRAA
jgi:hypothetical protein